MRRGVPDRYFFRLVAIAIAELADGRICAGRNNEILKQIMPADWRKSILTRRIQPF